MSKNTLLKFTFLVLMFAGCVETSVACMYGPPYRTVCETYAQADAVIIGKIESVEGHGSSQTVLIKVEKTFKGRERQEIVLLQPLSTCDWDFSDEVGRTLLLYLARHQKSQKYSALAEGMGGRVERENENLYWLNNLPKSLKRRRLSGTVALYRDTPFEFLNHVAGTKVRIFNAQRSFEVFTDENGVYEIWDIPPGKYQIEPVIPLNLSLIFPLERGEVDFDTLRNKDTDKRQALIEIQPKGCGGIDFVVKEAPEK